MFWSSQLSRIVVLLGLILCVGMADAQTQLGESLQFGSVSPNQEEVTRQQMGAKWPFTVERGILSCNREDGEIVFIIGDKTYAINDKAKKSKRHGALENIWADKQAIKNAKLDLSALLEKALKLCQ